MTEDRKKLYIISALAFAVLLIPLFMPTSSSRIVAACLLLPFAILAPLLLKKRSIPSIYKRQVLMLTAVIAVVYVVLLNLTGLSFGFYRTPFGFGLDAALNYWIPIILIIISSEIIRSVILAGQGRIPYLLAYLVGVLSDILANTSLGGLDSFNEFMDFVGLYMLPAFVASATYQYLAKRYGMLPSTLFRLIVTLYYYVLPRFPKIPDALLSLTKLFLPVIVFLFINALYERKKYFVSRNKSVASNVVLVIFAAIMISFVMLISCQFKYCAIVIGSESMSGELEKGDALIYESYDGGDVEIGQVLVFKRDKATVIHRVIDIKYINGETRYFTKGDANDTADTGYVVSSDIVGLARFKMPYLGYPTIWMRELFSKNN